MCGHDNTRCDIFFAWFVINKVMNVCLERLSVVCMDVCIYSSEDMHAGSLVGFLFDGVCSFFPM